MFTMSRVLRLQRLQVSRDHATAAFNSALSVQCSGMEPSALSVQCTADL